jgi:hypothetical protein
MTDHLSWDTLNDLADERLDARARHAAMTHLATCAECEDALAALSATTRAARALPPSIDPPDEVWGSIRQSIEGGKVAQLGRGGPVWWATPRRLAAAAAVLILASSGVTALVMRRAATTGDTTFVSTPAGNTMLPVALQAAERGYLASVGELHTMLQEQRGTLAPATIASVERSLATIDMAIAEARAALLADPANAALADLLASNYRQKIELLRRATELDPRS